MKKLLMTLCFSLLITPLFISQVEGSETDNEEQEIFESASQEEVVEYFDSERLEEMIEEANNMPVVPDIKAGPTTRASYGSPPTRKGVILVTDDAWKGVVPVGHAGILYTKDTVVEANEPGVQILKNSWVADKSQVYGVSVVGTSTANDEAAANWCYSQIGKPYNWNFYRMDYRHTFYCSHLVRSAFLDLYGIDLNTSDYDNNTLGWKAIHPMELVTTSKTSLVYRKK